MERVIVLIGCFLFEGQGVDSLTIVELEGAKIFESNDEAVAFGEAYIDGGGDSYYIVKETNR